MSIWRIDNPRLTPVKLSRPYQRLECSSGRSSRGSRDVRCSLECWHFHVLRWIFGRTTSWKVSVKLPLYQIRKDRSLLSCTVSWTRAPGPQSKLVLKHMLTSIPFAFSLWLAKVRPSLLLPSMMLGWSICTICMPAVTSGAGFCVVRFVTGLAEAPFFPGESVHFGPELEHLLTFQALHS